MRLLTIVSILREETQQQTLFVGDSSVEKVPGRYSICNNTKRIVKKDLSTDGKIEPARICWMTKDTRYENGQGHKRVETRCN